MQLILNNRITSCSELIIKLEVCFSALPNSKDLVKMQCDFVLYLIPESARSLIWIWDEFIQNKDDEIWARIKKDIFLVVSDHELAALDPDQRIHNRFFERQKFNSRKRRRIHENDESKSQSEPSPCSPSLSPLPPASHGPSSNSSSSTKPSFFNKGQKFTGFAGKKINKFCNFCNRHGHTRKFCLTETDFFRKAYEEQ